MEPSSLLLPCPQRRRCLRPAAAPSRRCAGPRRSPPPWTRRSPPELRPPPGMGGSDTVGPDPAIPAIPAPVLALPRPPGRRRRCLLHSLAGLGGGAPARSPALTARSSARGPRARPLAPGGPPPRLGPAASASAQPPADSLQPPQPTGHGPGVPKAFGV